MAKQPGQRNTSSNDVGTPKEYPQVPPPVDLYPTSDIRFVMVELGKLSTKVDRLIDDTEKSSKKTTELAEKVAKFETTITVGGILISAFIVFIWWSLGDHIKTAVQSSLRNAFVEGQNTQLNGPTSKK